MPTLRKIAIAAKMLPEYLKNLWPSFYPFDLLTGICGASIIYAVVYFKKKNAKKFRKDVEYGSARWGTAANIRPYIDPKPDTRYSVRYAV